MANKSHDYFNRNGDENQIGTQTLSYSRNHVRRVFGQPQRFIWIRCQWQPNGNETIAPAAGAIQAQQQVREEAETP
jgi:hypothetical protein